MEKVKNLIRRTWIPYIILIITLSITVISTYFVSAETFAEDQLRFLNAVSDTSNGIENRLQTYITLLRGVAGLSAVEPDMTEEQFDLYINRLRLSANYPGTQGIGFIQRVTNEEKDAYLLSVQNLENKQITIIPSGERAEYEIVRYLSLTNKHMQVKIGYDMATEPDRKKAMELARDTGTTRSSKKNTGFLLFTPLYTGGKIPTTIQERREKINGYIYSAFNTNALLNNILSNKTLPQLVNYRIYNSDELTSTHLIDNSVSSENSAYQGFLPRFRTTKMILVGGEHWTIFFSNHPQFDKESQKNLAPLIFLFGIIISIIFFTLSRSQYLARTKAENITTQLQQSQKELEKAIGLRDNFISIASHELKTPVTSLRVYAEVLLRQFSKKSDKKTADYLAKIIRQIDKLTLLIQDLLNVSRIQTNRLTFRIEKFDLNKMLKEVIESTQQIADHHRIVLEGTVSKKVWGDRERISQVVINLLTNALKYSPKANKILVKVEENKSEATVAVQDFGVGIGKGFQKKIFERFYRISGANEQTYPGLGIGLYISQAIIKYHGGEIIIESKKNKGSTFKFPLPFEKKRIRE